MLLSDSVTMSADFWASYVSGAVGILLGNHLDVLKVQAQARTSSIHSPTTLPRSSSNKFTADRLRQWTYLFRGAAAPFLGYGALNSILFMTFNRTLKLMDASIFDYTKIAGVDLTRIWAAGALGGLATWVISAPSELVKCRAQLLVDGEGRSWSVMRDVLRREGVIGLYRGGVVTSLRDAVGYGWYFWSCRSFVHLACLRGGCLDHWDRLQRAYSDSELQLSSLSKTSVVPALITLQMSYAKGCY